MSLKDGKTKNIGGSKDILECLNLKSDEQIMVEVGINQNKTKLSLSQFKELLFREDKTPLLKNNISEIINNQEYKNKYGVRMIQEFVDYWTEMLPNGKKQRWQKQKAFDVNRMLISWAKRDYNSYYKRHKEEKIIRDQEEYYRRAEEKVSEEESERQKRELKKITQGLFTHVKEM